MNSRNGRIRDTETVASPLEYHQGQKHSTETFVKARELRRWIHENPGKHSLEMPEHLRGYLTFLQQKRLVTWKRIDGKTAWFVKEIAPL